MTKNDPPPVLLTDIGNGTYKVFLKENDHIIGYVRSDLDEDDNDFYRADLVPELNSKDLKIHQTLSDAVRVLHNRYLEQS